MTLKDWLLEEKRLMEKATKGPWFYQDALSEEESSRPGGTLPTILAETDDPNVAKSIDGDCEEGDFQFIANVRTSHEKALRMLEVAMDYIHDDLTHDRQKLIYEDLNRIAGEP